MSKPTATTKLLPIGRIAERTGLSAKALRLYEARGLLAPDARSASGYRLYGATALSRLAEIGVLKRAGFTLAEIGKLLERKGSAAALIEARIVSLRKEVRAKSRALDALENAFVGLGPRWHALVNAFTGGDANIARKLKDAYAQEPQIMAAQGMDQAMFAYIREAMREAGFKLAS